MLFVMQEQRFVSYFSLKGHQTNSRYRLFPIQISKARRFNPASINSVTIRTAYKKWKDGKLPGIPPVRNAKRRRMRPRGYMCQINLRLDLLWLILRSCVAAPAIVPCRKLNAGQLSRTYHVNLFVPHKPALCKPTLTLDVEWIQGA